MKKQSVLIMCDSQRWDMLNCYRKTGLKTPNLDELAAQSIRFERAYTVQPVCGPARSALFTGIMPSVNGAWANDLPLYQNMQTIGERLQKNGIRTAYIGKYHLDGTDYFGGGECPDGWDQEYYYDLRMYLEERSERERVLSRSTRSMYIHPVSGDDTYGQQVVNRAVKYLQHYKEESFFLTVSFDEPHHPSLCPPPFDHMYDDYRFPEGPATNDLLEGKPEYQRIWAGGCISADSNRQKLQNSSFFGCNSYVDHLVGQLMKAIPESAMILYTSDHGDMLGFHSLAAKGPAGYDDVTRIPLILRMPGKAQGVYSLAPVSHIDICPTIMDYFGLPVPNAMQGSSLLPLVKDMKAFPRDPLCYLEFARFCQGNDANGGLQLMRGVTDGHLKLIINLLSTDELYDLDNDPGECRNLIYSSEYAQQRNVLFDSLIRHMDICRDPFRGYCWKQRSWRESLPPADWSGHDCRRQHPIEENEKRELDYATGLEIQYSQRTKIEPIVFESCKDLDELAQCIITMHQSAKPDWIEPSREQTENKEQNP